MFQNSLNIIEECELTFVHSFPYSSRKGTPAARMPQLPKGVVKQRAKELRQAADQQLRSYMEKQAGTFHKVLVEPGNSGRNEQYVLVENMQGNIGEIAEVQISGHNGKSLVAESQSGGKNTGAQKSVDKFNDTEAVL